MASVTVIGRGEHPAAPTVTSLGSLANHVSSALKDQIPHAQGPQSSTPTAIPSSSSQEALHRAPMPSMLPGCIRQGIITDINKLSSRFPGTATSILEQLKAVLATMCPAEMSSIDLLKYGVSVQDAVNHLLKAKLTWASAEALRQVPVLLRRLQKVFSTLLAGMSGGLFRKSVKTLWHSHETEVHQLEALLVKGVDSLTLSLLSLADIKTNLEDELTRLDSTYLAGEYLSDLVTPDLANVLQSRLLSLSKTKLLAHETLTTIQADDASLKELIVLVHDNVLVKLPALYGYLVALPDKPNETQRYLVSENLMNIIHILERKL